MSSDSPSDSPLSRPTRHGVDAATLARVVAREAAGYSDARPHSRALAAEASEHWHDGVPMHWMADWDLPFPLFVASAKGSTLIDADDLAYADFCLGDTGAMFGHAPEPVVRAVAAQAANGLTAMLPATLMPELGRLLAQRFGLPFWQMTQTASDANRAVIRWARAITRRPKILVFNGCYHGAVDDAHVRLRLGRPVQRAGLLGQVYDMTTQTRVVEFNDVYGLEAALDDHEVALVLAEPVMTNIGMVLPAPRFHEHLRAATRRTGTLLALDETHTISSGPGGYGRLHGLEPDFFVLGKPIAGGVPAAVYGFTEEVSALMRKTRQDKPGYSGIGTTLSANALSAAAMVACLSEVMKASAYDHMIGLATWLAGGLEASIARHGLPWVVTSVGARVEFMLTPERPQSGGAAAAIGDAEIEAAIRLYLINRGVVISPFHTMMLIAPTTTHQDAERLVHGFDACLGEIKQT